LVLELGEAALLGDMALGVEDDDVIGKGKALGYR
jgi:hypothetical protein